MRRRNMADDQLRAIERAYLATPADSTLLGQLLRVVARARGGAPGTIIWIDTLWRNNGLTPDRADLDVLADAVFESSHYSEDLRQNLEAVERIALAADASDLEDVHEDDRDQDQRAPWWRRERFHDIDFDRSHPHRGGRLYSPASGTLLTVSEIKRSRGKDKWPESRGRLLVERQIERPVYGVDAVLVDMAQGPITQRRSISTWLLRRVLDASANAATSLVRPFMHAVFVTDMREDPTDVVEQLAGAPAQPLGGSPRTYGTGRGPMTGLWEGALGRPGRVEVMRASGPDVSRLLDTALYQWRVANHPYRVRLDELRAIYHEERGGESLSLIWVGRGKRPDATDGVEIMSWSNENTDPMTEEFEWGTPIADQLDLDETNDWTSAAARAAHDAEAIVVEEWEEPPEREGPYELGNLLVAGVTCNERFSEGNEGRIAIGGDRGDVHALSAVNVGDGVLMHNARLVTTVRGLTDDEAVELAVEIVMFSWESIGEDTFTQVRGR